ncbi:uncharacterized protein B0H18DRAFT_1038202 [Fomitopsis serialis]|uniref:uncharacterized protein n=1 Tax=Fomitopsis serialis TaxID=139415 RepID=UPI0020088486|nr:uncharacterized protein B0H18DRAFT_1038202 [Neoantrodia serialis]KAH9916532.1 hypothetical protein B0H18DRAFT_1038202 [Neoantrodia serialis]
MNASLHTDLYKNGFPIACAVCFRQYGSYDVLVQHISLHHPLHSTEPVTHLKYRIRNERLPTFYDIFSTDQYAKDRIRNPCYPFTDYAELQWARWMNEQMNSPTIDKFLKVDWVRRHMPSFHSCRTLQSWIKTQPPGPVWQTATIKLEGYTPIAHFGEPKVIFRDPLECVKFLYRHPLFGAFASMGPEVVHTRMGQRVITDFSTATLAWNMQSKLPTGAEVVSLHLGSDKLAVTSHFGDYEMHPLLLTLAGLPATIRSRFSNDAWMCVAYLPVPKFAVHTTYQGILANRILHKAMDLVTANLKIVARFGHSMADPYGNVRLVFTPVVALSGDLVEHLSMAAVSSSVSPITLATSSQFGDGRVYARCTKAHTLNLIYAASKVVDVWQLHDFQRECKKVGLNGVHLPWWRDYLLADPSLFSIAVGTHELDRRFASRHKHLGYAALRRVSEVKQMTGRMQREIMRTIIVAIEGAVSPGFMCAMRAILDFLLAAQSPRHTHHLRTFHDHKKAIMTAGGPKLEILSNFVPIILSHGALPQWSCDSVEHLLHTEIKKPYRLYTNNRRANFGEQCTRHRDRVEKMRNLELYALFTIYGAEMSDFELQDAASSGLAHTLLEQKSPGTGTQRCIRASRTTRNLFATGSFGVRIGSNVAFYLNRRPSATYAIDEVADAYNIADFRAALADYMGHLNLDARKGKPHRPRLESAYYQDVGLYHVCVWETYRIQVPSAYNGAARPQTLRAIPPSAKYSFGILRADGKLRRAGPLIAQVRVVFEVVPREGHVLPARLRVPLCYIQDFEFADVNALGDPKKAANILMYRLKRRCYLDAGGAVQRGGEVVPLTA